jgi:hypothetical protein
VGIWRRKLSRKDAGFRELVRSNHDGTERGRWQIAIHFVHRLLPLTEFIYIWGILGKK